MTSRRRSGSPRAHRPRWIARVVLLALVIGLLPIAGITTAQADESETSPTTIPADEPEATATDIPAPTATATSEPPTTTATPVPPTATSTPAPTSTTAPTATAAPNSGPVTLAFTPNDYTVAAGNDLVRLLTISNGNRAQSLDLTLNSSAAWVITVTDESSGSQLASGQKRVSFSLPVLQPGETRTLVIRLSVPASAEPGEIDYLSARPVGQDGVVVSTTVATNPSDEPVDPETPVDPDHPTPADNPDTPTPQPVTTATSVPGDDPDQAEPARTLTIGGHGGSFGTMSILGVVDSTIPGLTSSADASGATYIKTGAVIVTIESDTPWVLFCTARGDAPQLTWRITGGETWSRFGSSAKPVVCARGEAGTTEMTFDLSLRIAIGGETGNLESTIAFTLGE